MNCRTSQFLPIGTARDLMPPSVRNILDGIEPESAEYPKPKLPELRKTISRGLFISSCALYFSWLSLHQTFVSLVVLSIVLPWISIALAARFPGDFTLSMIEKGSRREGLGLGWVLLAGYVLSAFGGVEVVGLKHALFLGCLPGALFFGVVVMVQKRCRVGLSLAGLTVVVLLSAIYGYGLVRELNIVVDRSPATVYPTVVVNKRYTRGGYKLVVGPWGSAREADSMYVAPSLYDSIKVGERVCIVVKEGALGMSWYSAQACPWNGKLEFP
jgi:hypothetical protein